MDRETCCDQHVKYQAGCADCKTRNKAWRDKNRQRIRDAQNARWTRLSKEINDKRRERHAENPERNRAQMRNWREKNPERYRELLRSDYYRHHESRKQRLRDGYKKFRTQRRLAAKLELQRLRVQALNVLGGKCVVCGIIDPRILNINHLHGGGTREHLANRHDQRRFYKKVISDAAFRASLDVRCYNDNILFEYEVGRRKWFETAQRPEGWNSEVWHFQYQMFRMRLLEFLGGHCVVCGQTNPRILTVNHIKGGGTRAFRSATSIRAYYRDILSGQIPRNSVEVRCMNDNILWEYEVGRRTWITEAAPSGSKKHWVENST